MQIKLTNLINNLILSLLVIVKVIINNINIIINRQKLNWFFKGY